MSHRTSAATRVATTGPANATTPAVAAEVSSGLTSADWITRKDMADLIRASVGTVVHAVETHELVEGVDAGNRKLVNVGDFLRIGKLRPEDLTIGNTPAESAEVLRARQAITELKERAAELTGASATRTPS